MKYQTSTVAPLLTGALFTLMSTVVLAQDTNQTTDRAPVHGDAAEIPARNPSVQRPQSIEESDINVRQEPSGPDIAPGVERDALVPIPNDNDGLIDPH